MAMQIFSESFEHDQEIPVEYTCDGDDRSPPLAWSGIPDGTRSLALIVDDPDAPDPAAPKMTWVHWLMYNLPPATADLPAGMALNEAPRGTQHGLNDWKRIGYGGPCPPRGRHRYYHKLYALDATLPDLGTPDKAALERAMRGHVLAEAQLIGTYEHA